MRTAFLDALCQVAEQNPHIWLLTGDLGYSVLEKFSQKFPNRFVNVGVAEQNMIGVAAGLALCGKVVFVYSIASFLVLRCLEQIRNDVCYHKLNVKIVAVGGGMTYGTAGYTHHATEDLAIMATLPNMTVIAPGDPAETRWVTKHVAEWQGACYLRLGKAGEPIIYGNNPDFEIGKAIVVREGKQVALVSTGSLLKTIVDAADLLAHDGINPFVLSLPTVKPFDKEAILNIARKVQVIISIEEHRSDGVLSGMIASLLIQHQLDCRFASFTLGEPVAQSAYNRETYLSKIGLTADRVALKARSLYKERREASESQ